MFSKYTSWIALIFVTLLALPLFGEAPKPMDFVKAQYKTVLESLKSDDIPTRTVKLKGMIASLVDHDDLAKRSLQSHWSKLTPEQRDLYRKTFKALIEATYVKRLSKPYQEKNYTVEWDEERIQGKVGTVIVFVMYEDTETEVEFTLHQKGNRWIIYDLAYDGASVVKTYDKNYGKIIDEQGFDALIQKMEDKIQKLSKP